MACFGSKTLRRKIIRPRSSETTEMFSDDGSSLQGHVRRMKKNFRKQKGHSGSGDQGVSSQVIERSDPSKIDQKKKTKKNGKHRKLEVPGKEVMNPLQKNVSPVLKASILRKKVDPETAKYFSEISSLFENNEVDLEERSIICANALDETRGKELELASDMIISHTLQTLVEGCELDQVCGFIQRAAQVFSSIAMDRYGSHVAETALKCLSANVQVHDADTHSIIEDTLTRVCEVVVVDPVDIMCCIYGSHVIRSLLCLCNGIPLESWENFHVTKSPAVLAERLKIKSTRLGVGSSHNIQHGFPHLVKFLVLEMLKQAGEAIKILRVNKYSSLVLQVALKVLVGHDDDLNNAILLILGCSQSVEKIEEGLSLDNTNVQEIVDLTKETASSHLLEVILEVAPGNLYQEILNIVFKGALFEISSHPCGNFVIQALISSARSKGHIELIWDELGPKMKQLLENGKPGIVASLLAACQHLESHGQECCKALAKAFRSESESPNTILPQLLFLESYLCCKDKPNWKWPSGEKMNVLGCLILQTIFKYPNQFFQRFMKDILSMETIQILEMAKDAGGSRVIESFLSSDASTSVKLKVISKLQGHYGELSLLPFGSFIVEKCFAAGDLSTREAVMLELLAIRDELSKTKHGPFVLRKLDVDGFAKRPQQWKSSQKAKEAVYRDFQAAFGSKDNSQVGEAPLRSKKSHKRDNGPAPSVDVADESPSASTQFPGLEQFTAKLGFAGLKPGSKRGRDSISSDAIPNRHSKKFTSKNAAPDVGFVRQGKKRKSTSSELADLAAKKSKLDSNDVRKLFEGSIGSSNQKKKWN